MLFTLTLDNKNGDSICMTDIANKYMTSSVTGLSPPTGTISTAYYTCGCFEIYISANPENVNIFQLGRIIGRDDDREHFGIIENIKIETSTAIY